MHRNGIPILTIILLCLPISVYSQTKNVFESTTTFRCKFSNGIAANWDSGELSQEKTRMKDDVVVSEINRKQKSAVIIGNVGKSPVFEIIGIGAINFIEVTPTSNLIVLTIFDKQLSQLRFAAVWSRHIKIMGGGPIVSQYYGDCRSID